MSVTTYAVHQAIHACAFGQVPVVVGATDDLVLVDGTLRTVGEALAIELRAAYPEALIATYDVGDGLRAADPADEAALRRTYSDLVEQWPVEAGAAPVALETGQPLSALAPWQALRAAAALLRQTDRVVGLVIDDADLLLHDPLVTDGGRLVLGALRSAFARRGEVRGVGSPNPLALVVGRGSSIGGGLATHPLSQTVVVTGPSLEERAYMVDQLELPREVAQLASALSRRRITALPRIAHALPNARPERLIRVALNGMPRRAWSAQDRERMLDQVAPAVERALPGQELVVQRVCSALALAGLPRVRTAGPRSVFLLAGPPAVGKTELVRVLSRAMFGDTSAICRIDMTEYMEPHSRAKLIGAPPGYVGHEGGGRLTDWVRSSPDSIVLLDEIEKAHEDVLLLLLQILEDGRLTDGQGRTVDFGGIVLLMTTNLGSAQAVEELTAGGADPDGAELAVRMRDLVKHAIETPARADGTGGLGRPELWSRLQGKLVAFDVVRRENVPRIAARLLEDFRVACEEDGHEVQMDIAELASQVAGDARLSGPEGTWDARSVLTVLTELIETPVRQALMSNGCRPVHLGVDGGRISIR